MDKTLANYTFLPWLRQGIGRQIQTIDSLGQPSGLIERASVQVSLSVNNTPAADNTVNIVGPGDVLGVNPQVVVKTEPRAWITDFEPNYLPFIEFFEEDFLWRYTPASATAQHRLRPWLFLAVLEESEFTPSAAANTPLKTITLDKPPEALLPANDQTWAWAHVHVNQDITDDSQHTVPQSVEELSDLVQQNPNVASSRLLCPRRLKPNTAYFAFVIPTFETGRLAGLGLATDGVDALQPSWPGETKFPVYYEWFFRTGERGDFEHLVNLLESRTLDTRIGIRDMNMRAPEFGVSGMTSPVGLEGALKTPGTTSRPLDWPAVPLQNFVSDLERTINLEDDLLTSSPDHPDPIISPPLYGRWHAKTSRLAANDKGWVNELNGDPRQRVASGFGSNAVQDQQEDFMQRAWQQLGDVIEANRRIKLAQLALVTSHRVYTEKFLPLAKDQAMASTQAMFARIKTGDGTLRQQVKTSRLPLAALNPTFRRVIRTRGGLMQKVLLQVTAGKESMIERLNSGQITAAQKKRPPGEAIFLDNAAKKVHPGILPATIIGGIGRSRRRRFTGPAAVTSLVGEQGLKLKAIEDIPMRDRFTITAPGVSPSSPRPGTVLADSKDATSFRTALTKLHERFEFELPATTVTQPLSIDSTTNTFFKALNPLSTIPRRLRSIISFPTRTNPQNPAATIEPIMAHPVFPDPMYKSLSTKSPELLIPNIGLIPMNTVALLETNRRFIESYLVGVNHEMSRELLWREYPTDQRGSYFRQFWDVGDALNRSPGRPPAENEERLLDIKPIHTWRRNSTLGDHGNRPMPTGEEAQPRLVLVIRGDLLKKYPTAVIFAQRAKWEVENGVNVRVLDETSPAQDVHEPVFKAEIEPDLKFLGFDLTASVAMGSDRRNDNDPGFFFVIQQRPGEPRFGLDLPGEDPPDTLQSWDELAWSHLTSPEPINFIDLNAGPNTNDITQQPDVDIEWGSNSAAMAFALFQSPVMVAFHAADMLPNLPAQNT